MSSATWKTVLSNLTPKRIGTFLLGTFAGACAAFFPRLAAQISGQSTSVIVDALPSTYVTVACAFAGMIGGITVIFNWNNMGSPRDIFMSALGIPALLTGALNTTVASEQVVMRLEERQHQERRRAEAEEIPIEDVPVELSFLPVVDEDARWFPELISTAHAQPNTPIAEPPARTLAIRYREPRYWIVLHTASTREEAERMAMIPAVSDLRAVVKKTSTGEYFVTLGDNPLSLPKALSKAIAARRSIRDATPKLVRSRSP